MRVAERNQPDLILLNDLKSSVVCMNTVKLLRENIRTHSIPIIVFSSENSSATELDERWNDVYFIVRPFDAQTMLSQMRIASFGGQLPQKPTKRTTAEELHPNNPRVLLVDSDQASSNG